MYVYEWIFDGASLSVMFKSARSRRIDTMKLTEIKHLFVPRNLKLSYLKADLKIGATESP